LLAGAHVFTFNHHSMHVTSLSLRVTFVSLRKLLMQVAVTVLSCADMPCCPTVALSAMKFGRCLKDAATPVKNPGPVVSSDHVVGRKADSLS